MINSNQLLAGVALAFASATLSTSAVAQEDWIARLAGADVVLLGEIHDNPEHHLRQAEAIASLSPAAVVFEMLTPDQAKALAGACQSRQRTWPSCWNGTILAGRTTRCITRYSLRRMVPQFMALPCLVPKFVPQFLAI